MSDNGPVMISIERSLLCEIRNLLVDGRLDAEELLRDHDERLGRTTRKNKVIAKAYEDQLASYNNAMDIIDERLGYE